MMKQMMGQLPPERVTPGSPPFTNVCLDLLGPTLVKGVVNKRSIMKVWPLTFVYQATRAIHLSVLHNYDTQTFLPQYTGDVNFRGKPTKIVSHKALVSWSWSEVEQKTEDELVPLTMNQLSIEHNPTQEPNYNDEEQNFLHLLPFYPRSDAKKHTYPRVSDICQLKYAEGSQVLTKDKMEVRAQRLCLILPVSDQNFEDQAWWTNGLILWSAVVKIINYNLRTLNLK